MLQNKQETCGLCGNSVDNQAICVNRRCPKELPLIPKTKAKADDNSPLVPRTSAMEDEMRSWC